MYSNILVPIDGSDTSMRGLDEAIKVASSQASHIRVLHIVRDHVTDAGYCIGTYEGDVAETRRKSSQKIVSAAERRLRDAGIASDFVVGEFDGDSAAQVILKQVRDWSADLIVMGTHGRRGLSRLAMGSDAESVVRDATVPVLLVRSAC